VEAHVRDWLKVTVLGGLLLMVHGCTTVRQGWQGSQSGEFYVMIDRHFFFVFGRTHVLRCQENERAELNCYRVLHGKDVNSYNVPKSGRYGAMCGSVGVTDGGALAPVRVDLAQEVPDLPDWAEAACREAYSQAYTEALIGSCLELGEGDQEASRPDGSSLEARRGSIPPDLVAPCEKAYSSGFKDDDI
jgi:hypothetical protein